ncbi:fumarylacetoacetate hydrolase family protein [Bacillus xiapuensis]|uniref:fumarylacetoacetate hydrolase family protein n=1 Tax=Bacillus xiapuensis TaxID=2014075 RepID=UPI000C242D6C|nr:fumarylacetoacetate hydrolase family protein [Bacillus xiapuensis]
MKLATVKVKGKETAAIISGNRMFAVETINEQQGKNWAEDLYEILQKQQLAEINSWYQKEGEQGLKDLPSLLAEEAAYAPLYRNPGKILGVGMNYREKALELSGRPPEEEPVIFMKPATSLIGPEETVMLPSQAGRVTAEAELGIIIGETCKEAGEEEARRAVAGFTAALDVTAKDIHAKNPRYLQRSKSFDTFFSFGPCLVTADEFPHLGDVAVETVLNGEVLHCNVVDNMMYPPYWLVSFFSRIMTLHPGDVLITGTPGSAVIRDGDVAECRIRGLKPLQNPVSEAVPFA